MKVIKEVICSKCLKRQIKDREELLQSDLFWRVCEFCNQYGFKITIRHKLTMIEWMEAFYNTMGFRVEQIEAFLKELLKGRSRL